MFMSQAPADLAIESTPAMGIRARLGQAVGLTFGERDRWRTERAELRAALRQLASENERLAQENQALHEAAAIWIRLYEKQLERANRTAELLSACKDTESR
jgi:hypothetical protein